MSLTTYELATKAAQEYADKYIGLFVNDVDHEFWLERAFLAGAIWQLEQLTDAVAKHAAANATCADVVADSPNAEADGRAPS